MGFSFSVKTFANWAATFPLVHDSNWAWTAPEPELAERAINRSERRAEFRAQRRRGRGWTR